MSLKKLNRTLETGKLVGKASTELHESVQNNIAESKKQIERSRQIASQSREIIVRVRLALAQSERIQLGILVPLGIK
jgi:hypothetical protein